MKNTFKLKVILFSSVALLSLRTPASLAEEAADCSTSLCETLWHIQQSELLASTMIKQGRLLQELVKKSVSDKQKLMPLADEQAVLLNMVVDALRERNALLRRALDERGLDYGQIFVATDLADEAGGVVSLARDPILEDPREVLPNEKAGK